MSLTREFTGQEIMFGIGTGIISKDVLTGVRTPTLDERLKLEESLNK